MQTIKLWRHNSTTGYWNIARICNVETAAKWMAVFQNDEPNVMFKLSNNRPRPCGNPSTTRNTPEN